MTTTEFAVLTVLTVETQGRALSGYDLLKIVERGLATRRIAPGERGPERQLYRVTKKGERLAKAWLEEPVPGDQDLFFLKGFYGGLMDPEALLAHYRQHRDDRQAVLDELRALEPTNTRTGHDYHHYFLLRLGIERAEQDVRWAEGVLKELES